MERGRKKKEGTGYGVFLGFLFFFSFLPGKENSLAKKLYNEGFFFEEIIFRDISHISHVTESVFTSVWRPLLLGVVVPRVVRRQEEVHRWEHLERGKNVK